LAAGKMSDRQDNNPADDDDYHDIKAICQYFNINMPLEYEAFERNFLQ
jgi:hypothetical protein